MRLGKKHDFKSARKICVDAADKMIRFADSSDLLNVMSREMDKIAKLGKQSNKEQKIYDEYFLEKLVVRLNLLDKLPADIIRYLILYNRWSLHQDLEGQKRVIDGMPQVVHRFLEESNLTPDNAISTVFKSRYKYARLMRWIDAVLTYVLIAIFVMVMLYINRERFGFVN